MVAVKLFFLILFGIIIIPFTLLVLKLILNAKKSSWEGEVVGKEHNTKRDFDTDRLETFYYLKVKLAGGGQRNIGLSKQMWDEYKVGDKIKKEAGQMYPHKA